MRFRQKFIIRVGVILVMLGIGLPFTWILFECPEDLQINHHNMKDQQQADYLAQPTHRVHLSEQSAIRHFPKVAHDPKSVFKQDVLGNYEPGVIPNGHGPGENGVPVETSAEEQEAVAESFKAYGSNMVASEKISLDRVVPDIRLDECRYWHYPEKLPTASVILVFHNEGWSTLVRTIHSVINMSPPQLLHEVILIDDFSDKKHFRSRLSRHIIGFKGKVKLFRNTKREGAIRSRQFGALYASAEVLLYLDAHCECNYNWLPPLLARIAYDRTIMAAPIIDGIDNKDFHYSSVYGGQHFRGLFEWGFIYKEGPVPEMELKKRKYNSEPYWSPNFAGGLYAIERNFFFELGGYDVGLEIWGGENYDIAFRVWLCGGSLEWVPCSRVGHVYKTHMPYKLGDFGPKTPVILKNYLRIAEVWFDDEFKEYFYNREPTMRGYPPGNISHLLQFKKDRNCHSFKWFMDNIAYDVYTQFPPPPPNQAWGEIKQKYGDRCWDSITGVFGTEIQTRPCHHLGGAQLFRINVQGKMALGERCLVAEDGITITIRPCAVKPSGPWIFQETSGLIQEGQLNKCVEMNDEGKISLQPCNTEKVNQIWEINNVNPWGT